jgi:pimeloyl-ACP methyl ester carboxylesterase
MPKVTLNGAEIYYEVHLHDGKRSTARLDARAYPADLPTLVLAHGVGGNHAIWFNQLGPFSESHRVVTFDHRGFGNSSDPQDLGRTGYADDLIALLDFLEVDTTALLGQSMGGGTCIGVVAKAPERVSALILADTLHAIVLPPLANEIMRAAQAATADLGQIERVLGSRTRLKEPVKATLYRQLNSFNATDRRNLKGAYPQLLTPEELGALETPILFIAGGEDVLFPVTAIREVQSRIKGAEFIEMDGVGHSAFYEDPATFNQHVLEFLNRQR